MVVARTSAEAGVKPGLFSVRGRSSFRVLATCAVLATGACAAGDDEAPLPLAFDLSYVHYTLDNGLEVVLHEDHSDPIVAVATIMHVGSSRERPGKIGFAHFFEHMSFNDSENVPVGSNRKLIPELGGTRNGGTSSDMTIYYEVVPKDAFEKIPWIDSDRLGFMINTVTEAALEREKQVVKNEKRQRVDNAPYGHTQTVQRAALYPESHPYHWTVIGSLDDLQSATFDDVRAFYTRLYGANNATLVIAGDIDIDETKRLVDYWFGEIRRGPEVRVPYPQPVYLETSRSLMYEDNFATLPELQIVFPTVEQFHEDQYAVDILTELLAGSRQAPLYEVIVDERQAGAECLGWAPPRGNRRRAGHSCSRERGDRTRRREGGGRRGAGTIRSRGCGRHRAGAGQGTGPNARSTKAWGACSTRRSPWPRATSSPETRATSRPWRERRSS